GGLHEAVGDRHRQRLQQFFLLGSRHGRRPRTISSLSEVLDLFCELAAVPSPPGEERAVADLVARYLRDLGLEADEDETGPSVGSTIGNLYARLEPTAPGEPLL